MWSGLVKWQTMRKVADDLHLRMAAVCVSAFVWWAILYPELCFTESTCEQVIVEKGEENAEEQTDFSGILGASGEEIVIRSRLFEWIEEKKSESD